LILLSISPFFKKVSVLFFVLSIKNARRKMHKLSIKIHVTLAVLAILISSLAAPTALALQPQETVCAMVCCIAEKHCCCKPHKTLVKGQTRDGKESFTQTEFAKPCPEECASRHSAIRMFSRDVIRGTNYHSIKIYAVIIRLDIEQIRQLTDVCGSHASRAPPSAFFVSV
jgi:hypothetical protein